MPSLCRDRAVANLLQMFIRHQETEYGACAAVGTQPCFVTVQFGGRRTRVNAVVKISQGKAKLDLLLSDVEAVFCQLFDLNETSAVSNGVNEVRCKMFPIWDARSFVQGSQAFNRQLTELKAQLLRKFANLSHHQAVLCSRLSNALGGYHCLSESAGVSASSVIYVPRVSTSTLTCRRPEAAFRSVNGFATVKRLHT